MEVHCPECDMVYEVSESHRNAYMFCLGCDSFFKIKAAEAVEEDNPDVQPEDEPELPHGKGAAYNEKSSVLIDEFLNPDEDTEDLPEDVPAEYIDFLSVGLDVDSSDILEHHEKHAHDEDPPTEK